MKPERGASADDPRSVSRKSLDSLTAEESVMLDAALPEVLARIPRLKVELDRVLVVALHTM